MNYYAIQIYLNFEIFYIVEQKYVIKKVDKILPTEVLSGVNRTNLK